MEPKTAKSRRTVMLSQRAVRALRDHRTRQLSARLQLGGEWANPDLVFPNVVGGASDPSDVYKRFKRTLKATGMPDIRFHDLRHTAATLLLQKGTHPKIVSEMLGHSSISLTLDTYSHVIPVMHAEAAATMDELFGS